MQEFAGLATGPASEFGDLCAERGHVPGAVNIPADDLTAPGGALLSTPELERAFRGQGLAADQRITAYCHTSDRSCLVWFVLHELIGYPSVKVHDGGWLEYGHLLGAPVEGPVHLDRLSVDARGGCPDAGTPLTGSERGNVEERPYDALSPKETAASA